MSNTGPVGEFEHHQDIGGVSKTIAYVYGGQGTIPSWSPDSKKTAFISNSKIE